MQIEDQPLTFRGGKVNNVSVLFKHVYLLDSLDRLDVELLEGGLKLLIIGSRALVDLLDLSSWSSLSSAPRSMLVARCNKQENHERKNHFRLYRLKLLAGDGDIYPIKELNQLAHIYLLTQ